MINKAISMALAAILVGLTACSSGMPVSQTTKDLQEAPQFSQQEKDSMSTEEKLAVYNESMTDDANKLVCRREKTVGSHMVRTRCKTRREIEQDRWHAQETLRDASGPRATGVGN